MKKALWFFPLLPLAVLLLGSLPRAVVMNFASYQGEPYQVYCSCYSTLPLGYGNWGPVLTMLLSAVLLVLSGWNALRPDGSRQRMTALIAFVAVLASLLNLLFQEMTLIGWGITGLLVLLTGLSWYSGRR